MDDICLASCGKIISIDGDTAIIDYGGVSKKANIAFIENAKTGDYVLVHVGFAIQKVSIAEYKKNTVDGEVANE